MEVKTKKFLFSIIKIIIIISGIGGFGLLFYSILNQSLIKVAGILIGIFFISLLVFYVLNLYLLSKNVFIWYIIGAISFVALGYASLIILKNLALDEYTNVFLGVFIFIFLFIFFVLYIYGFPFLYYIYYHTKKDVLVNKFLIPSVIVIITLLLAGVGFLGIKWYGEIVSPSRIIFENDVPTSLDLCKTKDHSMKDVCISRLVEIRKEEYDFGNGEICEEISSIEYKDKCYTALRQCEKISTNLGKKVCTLLPECNTLVLNKKKKKFDYYKYLEFSSGCPSLTIEKSDSDIRIFYWDQQNFISVDKINDTKIKFIKDKTFYDVTLEDCGNTNVSTRTGAHINLEDRKGVICIFTPQNNKLYKFGIVEEKTDEILISWSELK